MRALPRSFLLFVSILTTCAGPALGADSGILACTAITDRDRRLDCYDSEAAKMRSAIQQEERDTVSFFGLFGRRKADDAPTAAPVIGADGKPDVPIVGQGKISGITAHILSTSVDSNGHVIIITDTNQVWKTIETGSVRGGVEGAEITIRESSFNGFRLNVIGRTGEYRVQRIL